MVGKEDAATCIFGMDCRDKRGDTGRPEAGMAETQGVTAQVKEEQVLEEEAGFGRADTGVNSMECKEARSGGLFGSL